MKLGDKLGEFTVAGIADTHVLLQKGSDYKTVTPEEAKKMVKPVVKKVSKKKTKKKTPKK